MAHFNQSFHTASGALATSGMRSLLEAKSPVPPEAEQNCFIPAKQRRLSRPNNVEEVRLKRRRRKQKLRERKRKETRNVKQRRLEEKIKKNIEKELKATTTEMRSKAEFFWRKWREEKSLRTTSRMSIHEIDPANLKILSSGRKNKIGEGTFGICVKKMYRGHVVAVKQFKSHTSRTDVEKEAMMINSFDHPGLPFLFGINVQSKPYILVTEFYGIGGQCANNDIAVYYGLASKHSHL
ncbi:uncharacterized protein LOC114539575 [Dendronephthya gigantea]|uniref:uncharacterized protein LOC114539575 n=1 Tax=Dendronephthya gigantea TaxID=151771 RepID=UPI00106ADF53|nr:uncharacterized protein LOC114539575 [Dendronephthya gigantea]